MQMGSCRGCVCMPDAAVHPLGCCKGQLHLPSNCACSRSRASRNYSGAASNQKEGGWLQAACQEGRVGERGVSREGKGWGGTDTN